MLIFFLCLIIFQSVHHTDQSCKLACQLTPRRWWAATSSSTVKCTATPSLTFSGLNTLSAMAAATALMGLHMFKSLRWVLLDILKTSPLQDPLLATDVTNVSVSVSVCHCFFSLSYRLAVWICQRWRCFICLKSPWKMQESTPAWLETQSDSPTSLPGSQWSQVSCKQMQNRMNFLSIKNSQKFWMLSASNRSVSLWNTSLVHKRQVIPKIQKVSLWK